MSSSRRFKLVSLLALGALLSGTVQAETMRGKTSQNQKARMEKRFDGNADMRRNRSAEQKHTRWERMKAKCRQAMICRFDTDGDGQLSEEERTAAKEARRARRQEKGKGNS